LNDFWIRIQISDRSSVAALLLGYGSLLLIC
jgi:hypothetical protein